MVKYDNRWKMNRMGFVNFWLYKNQEFPLDHGHILLRGQNGSGKSITTQSFIPFILDGDRTPSRLDPFGSDARRMEYYFLGDGHDGREDETGYLYLEFVKEDTKEYRTIGIGQRAKKGNSTLGFWGFVLMDGRRIGRDCSLCRRISNDAFRPLTKLECRDLIGTNNFFTESQGDYKAAVNKYLFGFERMEQFEQFIRLLIKVRAPKLSKEFKPSRVYEILNDSLQTLSNDDTSAMVNAMEKMDEIETRLEQLKNTKMHLRSILDEYERYNRWVAARKAEAYWQSEKEYSEQALRWQNLEKDTKESESQLEDNKEQLHLLELEIQKLEDQELLFHNSGLEDQVKQRESLEKDQTEKLSQTAGKKARIEKLISAIHEIDVDLHAKEEESVYNRRGLNRLFASMGELNQDLCFSDHSQYKTALDQENEEGKTLIRLLNQKLRDLEKALDAIEQKLESVQKAVQEADAAEEALEASRKKLETCTKEVEAKQTAVEDLREQIISQWYQAAPACKELQITDAHLQNICALARQYSLESAYSYTQQVNAIGQANESRLNVLKSRKDDEINRQKEILNQLNDELRLLQMEKEAVPARSEMATACRRELAQAGIEAIPLYEAIGFSDLSEKREVQLEQQLAAAGMLDALILSDRDENKAEGILRQYPDLFLKAGKKAKNPGLFTVSESSMSGALKETVESILQSIGEDDGQFILREDGYFQNGLLCGWVHPQEGDEVRFIGAEMRRRTHARKIEEKNNEILEANRVLHELQQEKRQLEERSTVLQEEISHLPSDGQLHTNLDQLRLLEEKETAVRDEFQSAEMLRNQTKDAALNLRHEADLSMRPYPYAHSLDAYRDVIGKLGSYQDAAQSFSDAYMDQLRLNEQYALRKAQQDDKEDEKTQLELELRQLDGETERIRARIEAINQILNLPENQKLVAEIDSIRKQCDVDKKQKELLLGEAGKLQERVVQNKEQLEERSKQVEEAKKKQEIASAYYLEEMRLNFVHDCSQMEDPAVIQLAESVINSVPPADRTREVSEAVSRLNNVFQKHSVQMPETNIQMDSILDESQRPDLLRRRSVIRAAAGVQRIDLIAFDQEIQSSIDTTEQLIQQEDRKLFENILSDTLCRKLMMRISESKRWICDMSKLMKEMDSSMGLNFSLHWVPKAAEEEGQLSTDALERILGRDTALLSMDDKRKVAEHFRKDIQARRQKALDDGQILNYQQMVQEALDYRDWFEFRMYYQRTNENTKELTDRAFNTFSGGEKGMAMYVPLFAAVNAQYLKAQKKDHPRLIALDEAFAGVDEKNINSMFRLVADLDFDYIMNSQALWGCYGSVKTLRIAELLRPENADFITVIFYHWNGKERVLDEGE